MAQLEAHLPCTQRVTGSSPVISTLFSVTRKHTLSKILEYYKMMAR